MSQKSIFKTIKTQSFSLLILLVLTFLILIFISVRLVNYSRQLFQKETERNAIHQQIIAIKENSDNLQETHSQVYWDTIKFLHNDLLKNVDQFQKKSKNRQYIKTYLKKIKDVAETIENLNHATYHSFELFLAENADLLEKINGDLNNLQQSAVSFNIKDIEMNQLDNIKIINQFKRITVSLLFFFFITITVLLRSLYKIYKTFIQIILHRKSVIENLLDENSSEPLTVNSGYIELDNENVILYDLKKKLNQRFRLIEDKNSLEKELLEEQNRNALNKKLVSELQLDNLRGKLNPHFLFNSLNAVSKYALLADSETVVKIIQNLSDILRVSLSHQRNEFRSIAEELNLTRKYIEIQHYRFKDRITYWEEILVDESLLIPTMMIQNLVENSFKHGFKSKQFLEIFIIIEHNSNNDLQITVRDNGDGMKDINYCLESGFGLSSIKERLYLLYQREDLFIVKSKPGEFTEATIIIPDEDNNEKYSDN